MLMTFLASGAHALSGGALDRDPRYPAVPALRVHSTVLCSAVKIASHTTLLTAAHFVIDGRTGEQAHGVLCFAQKQDPTRALAVRIPSRKWRS